MIQAMLASVSSIEAQQTQMNVIGNNLANINTTAFKSSQVTFQDLIEQQLKGAQAPSASSGGTNPEQYGLGVQIAGTSINNNQGSLSATNVPSDLAIQGNGYFMVGDGSSVSYSRDGAFDLDANGNLVQGTTGQRLLGWSANATGAIDTTTPISPTSTISIPLGELNAVQQTSQISLAGNLDAAATQAGTTAATTWSMQSTVYDSLGGAHNITITFSNPQLVTGASTPTPPATATSSWDWTASEDVNGNPVTIGGDSAAYPTDTPVYFNAAGTEVSSLAAGSYNQITLNSSGAAPAFTVNLDFSSVGQLSAQSSVAASNQNGFPPGSLQSYSIGDDGTITGLFTNGLTRSLGQVAMAIFPNPDGLQESGSDLYQATDNSGIPVIGTPASGGRGSISAGYLEQSNVDISTEFSDLIITQRGFEANTKVVTTVDQMLQDLIQMKQ
jgi:flagellar hook protein FlgE